MLCEREPFRRVGRIPPDPDVRCRRAEALRPLTVNLVDPNTELDVCCVGLTGFRTSTRVDARSMTRNELTSAGTLVVIGHSCLCPTRYRSHG